MRTTSVRGMLRSFSGPVFEDCAAAARFSGAVVEDRAEELVFRDCGAARDVQRHLLVGDAAHHPVDDFAADHLDAVGRGAAGRARTKRTTKAAETAAKAERRSDLGAWTLDFGRSSLAAIFSGTSPGRPFPRQLFRRRGRSPGPNPPSPAGGNTHQDLLVTGRKSFGPRLQNAFALLGRQLGPFAQAVARRIEVANPAGAARRTERRSGELGFPPPPALHCFSRMSISTSRHEDLGLRDMGRRVGLAVGQVVDHVDHVGLPNGRTILEPVLGIDKALQLLQAGRFHRKRLACGVRSPGSPERRFA